MCWKSNTRACFLGMTILAFALSTGAAQTYQYPRDDLVVLMNGSIFNLIDHLGGTSYDAFYHNNGNICTTPLLSGTLSHFADIRDSDYDLLNGTVKTSVALSIWVDLQASQCINHTIDVGAGCASPQIPLIGPPGAEFFTIIVCALNVNNIFGVALPVPIKVPYPVVLPPNFDVTLPQIPTTPTLSLNLSFASYDASTSTWKPLPPPADHQKVWPLSGDLAFVDYITNSVSNPSDIVYRQGKIIAAKATATHPRVFKSTTNIQNAIDESTGLVAFFSNYPDAMAVVRMRDSLIAPQQISAPTDPRYGLIGGLFPLIIQGSFKASSAAFPIDFSAVISSVTVSISSSGIQPHITIEDIKASVGGRSVPARLVGQPAIAIDMPTVNSSDGSVHLQIKNLTTSLAVEDTDPPTVFSIGNEVRDALNKVLPSSATVAPSIVLGLPQCVAMNNVRFEALSPCADYNHAKVGYISRGSGPAPVTYSVNFAKTTITATAGEIELDFQK